MKFYLKFLSILVVALGFHGEARGCRFNVRDLGFVDQLEENYTIQINPNQSIQSGALMVHKLAELSGSLFQDANIEWFKPDQQEALQSGFERESSSSFVLKSPDGHVLALDLDPSNDSILSVLENLVASEAREAINQGCVESFAVVVLVEGADEVENRRAESVIHKSIDTMNQRMSSMPKPIANGPRMMTITKADRASEELLLWSVGLSVELGPQPSAFIVYGKSRWIGPMIVGPEISEPNLVGLMSFIGADCECGMDLEWTRGTRLLTRWGEDLRKKAAVGLGFDPDNPSIRMEVAGILEKARRMQGSHARVESVDHAEGESTDPRPKPTLSDAQAVMDNQSSSAISNVPVQTNLTPGTRVVLINYNRVPYYIVGAILLIGFWFLMRAFSR